MELPTDTDRELIEAARAAIDANTDTSGPDETGVHTMGAAVRDSEGRVHVGVNLAHFTGGPCAELVALATARVHGARRIEAIVAVGNHGRGVVRRRSNASTILAIGVGRSATIAMPLSVLITGCRPGRAGGRSRPRWW